MRLRRRKYLVRKIACFAATILFCLLCPGVARAQHDLPFCLNDSTYRSLTTLFLEADSTIESQNYRRRSDFMPGYSIKVNLQIESIGEWRHDSKNYNTWILKVQPKHAAAISLVLSKVKLREGEKLYIYNSHDMKGPFKNKSIPRSGVLPIGPMAGNEIVLEYDVPISYSQHGNFNIENIFVSLPDDQRDEAARNDSCYPCLHGNFWEQAKRSVVRIITFRESEAIHCSGVLVNNTLRDATPYILTANHCLATQDEVDRAVFTFNLDDADCDGIQGQPASLIGGTLVASSYAHDFSLVKLDRHVPLSFQPWFAGWDISGTTNQKVACIHHPLGGAKKISVEKDEVKSSDYNVDGMTPHASGAFWKVEKWDVGTTEGGSSGAPLFNSEQRVVGTLSGGTATCGVPYNDYFQKLSASWTDDGVHEKMLRNFLDPNLSMTTVIDGFDPAADMQAHCDTLCNLDSFEAASLQILSNDNGHMSGCNDGGITSCAEQFFVRDTTLLSGARIFVGAFDPEADGGIVISVNTSVDGMPGSCVYQKYLPYSELHLFFNDIDFYPGIKVSGDFFISYSPDCTTTSEFAIGQTDWRASKYNSAWIRRLGDWLPMSYLHEQEFGSSLAIEAMVCTFHEQEDFRTSTIVNLYPNPSSSTVICSIKENYEVMRLPFVCDLQGRVSDVIITPFDNEFLIDVSGLNPGVYVLSIWLGTQKIHRRFVKK